MTIVYDDSHPKKPLTLWTSDLNGLRSLLEKYRRYKTISESQEEQRDYSWLTAYIGRPSRPAIRALRVQIPAHDSTLTPCSL